MESTSAIVGRLRNLIELNHTNPWSSEEDLQLNQWAAEAQAHTLELNGYACAIDLTEQPEAKAESLVTQAEYARLAELAATARRDMKAGKAQPWKRFHDFRGTIAPRLDAGKKQHTPEQLARWAKIGIRRWATIGLARSAAGRYSGKVDVCRKDGYYWTWPRSCSAGPADQETVVLTISCRQDRALRGSPFSRLSEDGKDGHVRRLPDVTPRETPWGKSWPLAGAVTTTGHLWGVTAHEVGRGDDPTAWAEMVVRAASPEGAEAIFRKAVHDDPESPRWTIVEISQSAMDWENDAESLDTCDAPALPDADADLPATDAE